MRQGATAGLPKNGIGPPSLGAGIVLRQSVQMSVAFQPRACCVFLEQDGYLLLLHRVIKPLSSTFLHTVSLNCRRSSKEPEWEGAGIPKYV